MVHQSEICDPANASLCVEVGVASPGSGRICPTDTQFTNAEPSRPQLNMFVRGPWPPAPHTMQSSWA